MIVPFSLEENLIVTQLGPLWSHSQVTKSFSQTPLYVRSLGMWCFPGADEEASKLPDAPPSPWPMEKRLVVILLHLLHSHQPVSEFGVLLKE
jgi:hypothetical protein